MLKIVLFFFACITFSHLGLAADNFTIYLTRHAEKQPVSSLEPTTDHENSSHSKNPTLTACGKLRAKQLARLLSAIQLDAVYSTPYQRTMQTAQPTAKLQATAIKNYNPKYLAPLALDLKLKRKNTLVVGHSNTTPLLAELLVGKAVAPIAESNYQVLYQIQFIGDEKILTQLTQPLICKS